MKTIEYLKLGVYVDLNTWSTPSPLITPVVAIFFLLITAVWMGKVESSVSCYLPA